jgi:hypothetical protein
MLKEYNMFFPYFSSDKKPEKLLLIRGSGTVYAADVCCVEDVKDEDNGLAMKIR